MVLLLSALLLGCSSETASVDNSDRLQCDQLEFLVTGDGFVASDCFGTPVVSNAENGSGIRLEGGVGSHGVEFVVRPSCKDCVLVVNGQNVKGAATIRVFDGENSRYMRLQNGPNSFSVHAPESIQLIIYQDSPFVAHINSISILHAPTSAIAQPAENFEVAEEKTRLRRVLNEELGDLDGLSELEKVQALLGHLANVSLIEGNWYGSTKERFRATVIYEGYSAGIGQLCNGLADAAIGVFEIYGLETRRIRGQSIIPGHPQYDRWIDAYGVVQTHSTVEVKVGNRWIIADPTYFMIPTHEGAPISLEQGLALFLDGRGESIQFNYVSRRNTVEDYFGGKRNRYWQDLLFSNQIEYLPFMKYPYNDVYVVDVSTPKGDRAVHFYAGDSVIEKVATRKIEWTQLVRD